MNRGVSGIVLAPCDPDALVPAVKKAWEARIPVVIIDSALSPGAERYYRSFLATDNRKAGELAAKALIAKVGTEGKIAVMSYVAGAGSEIGRVGGFTDYVKAKSKLQIVGPYYSQSQMATALNQTTDVLAANADLKAVFGANEPTAVGMARALKQAGQADKVTAVGLRRPTGICRTSSRTVPCRRSSCRARSRWGSRASRRSSRSSTRNRSRNSSIRARCS